MKVPLPEKRPCSGDPNINEKPFSSAAIMTAGTEALQGQQQQQVATVGNGQQPAPSRLYPDLVEVYRAENLDYNNLHRVDSDPGPRAYPNLASLNITASHPDETADSNPHLAVEDAGHTGSPLQTVPAVPSTAVRTQPAAIAELLPSRGPRLTHTDLHQRSGNASAKPGDASTSAASQAPRQLQSLQLTHVTLEGITPTAPLSRPTMIDVTTNRPGNDVSSEEAPAPRGKSRVQGGLAMRKVIVDAQGNLRCPQGHILVRSQDQRSFEEIPADYDVEADYDPEEDYEEWDDASTTVANMAASHLTPKALLDKRIELRGRGGGDAMVAWASWRRHVNSQLSAYSQARSGKPAILRPSQLTRKELTGTIIRSCVDKSREEPDCQTSLPARPYIMYGIPRAKLHAEP